MPGKTHNPIRRSLVLATSLLTLLSQTLAPQLAGANAFVGIPTQTTESGSLTASASKSVASPIALPIPVKSGLAAYDASPLHKRMPVVLVHGIGSQDNRLFDWQHFLAFTRRNGEFQKRYKIYLYHYDSGRSVPAISQDLQARLRTFLGEIGGTNIKILAYSEGGLLVRNALQDSYLNDHATEVLTIATPFHGSPLANPEWLQSQVKSESPFSLVRIGVKQAYAITNRKYPTFREDFHWDNFDGSLPLNAISKGQPNAEPDYALAHKKNFIAYGSYFGSEVDPAVLPQVLGLKNAPPSERAMFLNLFRKNLLFSLIRHNIAHMPLASAIKAIPATAKAGLKAITPGMGNSNADLIANSATTSTGSVIVNTGDAPMIVAGVKKAVAAQAAALSPNSIVQTNASMGQALSDIATLQAASNIPTSKMQVLENKALAQAEAVSLMMYNDGISPISSSLWLGRYISQESLESGKPSKTLSPGRLWDALRSLKGKDNVRLFAGLDHRNWMDGNTRTGKGELQDLLNPDEAPRSVFEWIIYDLMS